MEIYTQICLLYRRLLKYTETTPEKINTVKTKYDKRAFDLTDTMTIYFLLWTLNFFFWPEKFPDLFPTKTFSVFLPLVYLDASEPVRSRSDVIMVAV